jgi:hypothetical protein
VDVPTQGGVSVSDVPTEKLREYRKELESLSDRKSASFPAEEARRMIDELLRRRATDATGTGNPFIRPAYHARSHS